MRPEQADIALRAARKTSRLNCCRIAGARKADDRLRAATIPGWFWNFGDGVDQRGRAKAIVPPIQIRVIANVDAESRPPSTEYGSASGTLYKLKTGVQACLISYFAAFALSPLWASAKRDL
jgi:hypothetical protein